MAVPVSAFSFYVFLLLVLCTCKVVSCLRNQDGEGDTPIPVADGPAHLISENIAKQAQTRRPSQPQLALMPRDQEIIVDIAVPRAERQKMDMHHNSITTSEFTEERNISVGVPIVRAASSTQEAQIIAVPTPMRSITANESAFGLLTVATMKREQSQQIMAEIGPRRDGQGHIENVTDTMESLGQGRNWHIRWPSMHVSMHDLFTTAKMFGLKDVHHRNQSLAQVLGDGQLAESRWVWLRKHPLTYLLRWTYLLFAVIFEITSGVLMKRSHGFRNGKAVGLVAVTDVCVVVLCINLLQSSTLKDAWAIYTLLEYIGMTVAGILVFERRLSRGALLAIVIGLVGAHNFHLYGVVVDNLKPPKILDEKYITLYVSVIFVATISIHFSYLACQHVKWHSMWLVNFVKFGALLGAILFEVLTAIMMKLQIYSLSVLCAWATSAFTIILFEFMDLNVCWALLTGLVYASVESAAFFLFKEKFAPSELWGAAAILISVTMLALEDSGYFVTCEHISAASLLRRARHLRRQISSVRHSGRVAVLIGAGAVGKLVLHKVLSDFEEFSCVVVIDKGPAPLICAMPKALKKIFRMTCEIDFETMDALGLQPGDIVVELGHKVSTFALVSWCYKKQLHFVNARVSEGGQLNDYVPIDEQIERLINGTSCMRGNGPTSVLLHGMNPGLVTYCVKSAVQELGKRLQSSGSDQHDLPENDQIRAIAQEIRVRSVDVTEVDTQRSEMGAKENEFVGTWSCHAFFEEVAKAESASFNRVQGGSLKEGKSSMLNEQRSVIFGESLHEFTGYIVSHEEVYTIPTLFPDINNLSVRFVYRPSQQMVECLERSAHLTTNLLPVARDLRVIDTDTHADTYDAVGAFVRTEKGHGQWCGLKCTASKAWEATGAQGNATSWLTALGVVLGIKICLNSPSRGVCFPEDLNCKDVQSDISKYMINEPADEFSRTFF